MAIATIEGIPVYEAIISDEATGMFKISLVDSPAVMSNFLAFDNVRKLLCYQVANEEKRLVRGVVMRADFPIYRRDSKLGEYYVIYKAEQIRTMAEKYLLESRQNDVNLMHEAGSDVEGVQMVQYFIKGDGVSVEGFDDIADGSLFAEFHITNDEIWESVKSGTYKGFSLEGVFDLQPEEGQQDVNEMVDSLDGAFNALSKKFSYMSTKIQRFKAALARALAAFASVTTDKGILVWDGDDDLQEGFNVYIEDAEGNRTDAPDGDYTTDDKKVIRVVEGKVAEIVDPEAEVDSQFGSKATDKGELLWDGEEDLKEGDEVFVEKNGERVPAEDGDYTTEDAKVIKVAEGKVAEIVDDEAEVAEEPAAEEDAEDVAAIKAENEALRAEVESLKAKVEKLSAMPMAKSAHEEVKTSQEFKSTGHKGLDRLSRVLKA